MRTRRVETKRDETKRWETIEFQGGIADKSAPMSGAESCASARGHLIYKYAPGVSHLVG